MKLKFLLLIVYILVLFLKPKAIAEIKLSPLIITANNKKQHKTEISDKTLTFTKKELEEQNIFTLSELVNKIPQIQFYTTGGYGKQQNIFIRGSDKIIIMINSIELTDPTSINNLSNYGNINLSLYDKVEIVMGSQNATWGTGAAGAINLITDNDRGKNLSQINITQSSREQINLNLNSSYGYKKLQANLGVSYLQDNSRSAIIPAKTSDTLLQDIEKDRYINQTANLDLKYKFNKKNTTSLFLQNKSSNNNYDGLNSNFKYDVYDKQSKNNFYQQLLGVKYEYSQLDKYNQKIKLTGNNNIIQREYSSLNSNNKFEGQVVSSQAQYQLRVQLESFILKPSIVIGKKNYKNLIKISTNKINPTNSYDNTYILLNNLVKYQRTNINLTLRNDNYSSFNAQNSYKIGLRQNIYQNSSIFINKSNGNHSPSLFQLNYNATENLQPEQFDNFDWGVNINSKNIINGSPAYSIRYNNFDNIVKQQISYTGNFPEDYYYNNPYITTNKGEEIYLSRYFKDINTNLSISYAKIASYYYKEQKKVILGRRPNKTMSLSIVNFQKIKENTLKITAINQIIGGRYEKDTTVGEELINNMYLPTFNLWHVMASYNLGKKYKFIVKINNIFDAKYYNAVASYKNDKTTPDLVYSTERMTMYLGVNITL